MIEAEAVKTILSAYWNAANTDGVTPVIDLIYNRSDIDVRNADYVLLYQSAGAVTIPGTKAYIYQTTISLDLRTTIQSRFKKYIIEIRRIIEGKQFASYSIRLILVRETDLSDRTRSLYRKVFDVYFITALSEITGI